jgi:hypothetical protein
MLRLCTQHKPTQQCSAETLVPSPQGLWHHHCTVFDLPAGYGEPATSTCYEHLPNNSMWPGQSTLLGLTPYIPAGAAGLALSSSVSSCSSSSSSSSSPPLIFHADAGAGGAGDGACWLGACAGRLSDSAALAPTSQAGRWATSCRCTKATWTKAAQS